MKFGMVTQKQNIMKKQNCVIWCFIGHVKRGDI